MRCRWMAMVGLLVTAGGLPAATLVQQGQSRLVILVPEQAPEVVGYAARELAYHVTRATGYEPAVRREQDAPRTRVPIVALGDTKLARDAGIQSADLKPDSCVLRVNGDRVLIAGRDTAGDPLSPDTWAGTLFGVYELLQTTLGVRWLWPGQLGEVVPQVAVWKVPDTNRTVAPRLIIRRLRSTIRPAWGAAADLELAFTPQATARAQQDERVWMRRQRLGHSRKMSWGHAFTNWWERYGQEHPDWFNLLDGVRKPQGSSGASASMCVSNPGLHQQIVANWRVACAASPDNKPNINGCENDVFGRCQCEVCKSWDVPRPDEGTWPERFSQHGVVSDRYARFWRTLQELAAQEDPDAIVTAYAYVNYAPPPVREKLNDHVWIGLVPDSFFPRTPAEQKQCLGMWEGWARTGCKLFLRPNYTLEGYCLPFLYTHQYAEEFAHHARQGMIATDFDSLTAMWAVQGPQCYLFARWQSCLDQPVDAVLAEYYSGFGPAARAVKAYFDYWEAYTMSHRDAFREAATKHKAGWNSFARMAHACFTPEAFAQGHKLLTAARQATAADPVCRERVEFLAKGLVHAEKSCALAAARATNRHSAIARARQDLVTYRRQIEGDNVVNLNYCAFVESRSWPAYTRTLAYGGEKLRPVTDQAPGPLPSQPWSLRGAHGFVALLGAGEHFRAQISCVKVGGRVEPCAWSLSDATGKTVAEGSIEPGRQAVLDVPVPAPGVYNLIAEPGGNAMHVLLENNHTALLGNAVAGMGESGPWYFHVPAGARTFTLKLSSPAPGETVSVQVLDPAGQVAATGATGPQAEVTLTVTVAPGQDGKSWSVRAGKAPTGVLEDYSLQMGLELPGYWSPAADRALALVE